ncbi:MAG: hypothetical protein K5786_05585 [Treponema sp.]|nr:hypothetical protein [Treponema sp.]
MNREEIITNCKIKTKEQFIDECRKNGINDDWYNFSEEHTRPVSIGEEHVTYGIGGWTGCPFPETRWDVALEQLLKYKDFVEWEASGSPLKIKNVEFKTEYYLEEMRDGYATFWDGTQTDEPVQELLDEGWIFDNYDHYMGECNYHKRVRYDELVAYIAISFIKRTDERDKKEFGFTESSMRGSYTYPVPTEFRQEIFQCMEKDKNLSEDIKNKLVKHFEKSLIQDEFKGLVQLKKELPEAMLKALDSSMPKTKQKKAILKAAHTLERTNPANDNTLGSRSLFVCDKIYDNVFEKAGISERRNEE